MLNGAKLSKSALGQNVASAYVQVGNNDPILLWAGSANRTILGAAPADNLIQAGRTDFRELRRGCER